MGDNGRIGRFLVTCDHLLNSDRSASRPFAFGNRKQNVRCAEGIPALSLADSTLSADCNSYDAANKQYTNDKIIIKTAKYTFIRYQF